MENPIVYFLVMIRSLSHGYYGDAYYKSNNELLQVGDHLLQVKIIFSFS